MANEKKVEVGIIGQMYEERKSKRLGVLESREEKYKTLMLRDPEGKSFNITYSTFKSNWRKYQGEVVAETSTQVEEKKATKAKEVAEAKATVEKKSEKPKMTRDEKVKFIKATKKVIEAKFSEEIPDAKINSGADGSIKIYYKHKRFMGVWYRDKEDRFTFDTFTQVAEKVKKAIKGDDGIDVLFVEDWTIGYKFRFAQSRLDEMLDAFISAMKETITELYPENEKDDKNDESEE